jgi:hypothetical protein
MTEVRSPAAEETFPRLLLGVQQYVAYMTSLDGYHSLQDQMNRFGEHVEYLCQDRETLIPHIKGQVQLLVNEIWPKGKVEVYGSFITGLCLPSSDVDLVVSNIGTDLRQGLFTLADALCRERNIDANKVRAQVTPLPLILLTPLSLLHILSTLTQQTQRILPPTNIDYHAGKSNCWCQGPCHQARAVTSRTAPGGDTHATSGYLPV